MKNKIIKPEIFISYSWSTVDKDNWIVELAERLMSDGVNVRLDKWNLKEGQDKYTFMESMVTDNKITKVLIICDKLYKEKSDRRKGGVGTESQIISEKVYKKVDQEKFIPIVRERNEKNDPYLPIYLSSRLYIDLSDDVIFINEYEKLLRNIFNKPMLKKPPLGTPPLYLFEEEPLKLRTSRNLKSIKSAIFNDKKHYKGLVYDFLKELLSALDDFKIDFKNDREQFDDKIIDSINKFIPYRDDFIDLIDFLSVYVEDDSIHENIFEFFQNSIKYMFPLDHLHSNRRYGFDNYRFILRELFLYLISILIKHRKFKIIEIYLDNLYFHSTDYDTNCLPYMIFDKHLESLDVHRNKRLKLNSVSITADLIKDRANNPKISFNELFQTDIILSLRSVLQYEKFHYWFPRTIIYNRYTRCELFIKAKMKRYFKVLKLLLKVTNKEDLLQKYVVGAKIHGLPWHINFDTIDFKSIVNFEELDTI